MLKRFFDVVVSLFILIVLFPVFIVISLLIVLGSKGPVFYRQIRIGKNGEEFRIFKFRTMYTGSDKSGLITIGKDRRITSTGYFLRKYKLDELPQFINVVTGDMSIVGPRPEVKKYVQMYSEQQRKVLEVKPGITDYASIEYSDENDLLGKSSDPEKEYVQVIMPAKLNLNLKYISDQGFFTDIKIILLTLKKIIISH
jgi:lipopolysaccharide/colanic/teichoic acid biosynthesis glycosyltransferase